MLDLFNNPLEVGDIVAVNKNTITGSSTTRKILKKATIEKFTSKQILTTVGYATPDNVVKPFSFEFAKRHTKMQLELLRDSIEEIIDKAIKNDSTNEFYYDRILDAIDLRINKCEANDEL